MSVGTAIRSVDSQYVHYDKVVRPGYDLTLSNSVLKWYEIAPPKTPFPPKSPKRRSVF